LTANSAAHKLPAVKSFAWLVCLLALNQVTAAEERSTAPAAAPDSVQAQLDQLKIGQERLFRELEQIKTLLQDRAERTNGSNKPAIPNVVSANVHGEPFRGTNTARVAVIEYSDFGCSFCGRYARNVFPRVDEDYLKTGKVRYFFRDLPEPHETNSWFKARAARCAGDQGKFWEMHDLFFTSQSATGAEVVTLASTLGLDMDQFNECLSSQKYIINIQRSADSARRMGLYGTPAFLIGSLTQDGDFVRVKKVLVGAESYENLKAVLDEMLSGGTNTSAK
jgi:protein-disulfide isomerase